MARGGFTEKELEALNNNKYVIYAENNRIVYSNEFKHLFIKELLEKGKNPTDIFRDAGFNVTSLGSKRIERATARWKESYAAGTLGNYDDSSLRKIHAENESRRNKDLVQEKFDALESRIRFLEEIVSARDAKIIELKKNLDGNVTTLNTHEEIQSENRLLRAEVEALTTIFIREKEKYDYEKKDRKKFYELIDYLLEKYKLDSGVTELLDTIDIKKRGYFKHKILKNKKEE